MSQLDTVLQDGPQEISLSFLLVWFVPAGQKTASDISRQKNDIYTGREK